MTPHSHPRPGRAVARRLARRVGVIASVALVVGGAPLVAQASAPATATAATELPLPTADAVDPALATVVAVLSDTYTIDERGPRVVVLQQLLGVTPDGWYGRVTERAHVSALVESGLLTASELAAAGPAPSEWAALRDCEAGGDYSITSRSGKYRGAYQFDRSTWNSVAQRHDPTLVGVDPAAASPAQQDAMALALYTERGARPWPHCGRHFS